MLWIICQVLYLVNFPNHTQIRLDLRVQLLQTPRKCSGFFEVFKLLQTRPCRSLSLIPCTIRFAFTRDFTLVLLVRTKSGPNLFAKLPTFGLSKEGISI